MFIQTEQTPNPSSIKFIPGCEVMLRGTAEFTKDADFSKSPLAARFFKIEGITEVFFGGDFVTITKDENIEWDKLQTAILGEIMEHFTNGDDVIIGESVSEVSEDDSEIVKQIKELLDTRVRPMVAQDGGDIVFAEYDDGIVYLYLKGACSGCPSSTMTLKNGVENLLKHFIPEVKEVRAAN